MTPLEIQVQSRLSALGVRVIPDLFSLYFDLYHAARPQGGETELPVVLTAQQLAKDKSDAARQEVYRRLNQLKEAGLLKKKKRYASAILIVPEIPKANK
jgi:CRP-like cAMP-binding protein